MDEVQALAESKPPGNDYGATKYDRELIPSLITLGGKVYYDVYSVTDAFIGEGDSALAHAAKKILCAGKRGKNDKRADLNEAIVAIQKALKKMDYEEKANS